jgi:hypothetical protein
MAVGLLVCAFCAAAQNRPDEPVTATVTNDTAGSAQLTVRNVGKSELTAFLYLYTLYRDPNGGANFADTGYYDSATDPEFARPIPPGGELTLPYRIGGNGFFAKVAVGAGIFADGATFGDKATVQHILDRRNFMLVSLRKSLAELQQASADKLPREQILANFSRELNREASLGLDPEMTNCIQQVRGQVIATLRTARTPDGDAIPVQRLIDSLVGDFTRRKDILMNAR